MVDSDKELDALFLEFLNNSPGVLGSIKAKDVFKNILRKCINNRLCKQKQVFDGVILKLLIELKSNTELLRISGNSGYSSQIDINNNLIDEISNSLNNYEVYNVDEYTNSSYTCIFVNQLTDKELTDHYNNIIPVIKQIAIKNGHKVMYATIYDKTLSILVIPDAVGYCSSDVLIRQLQESICCSDSLNYRMLDTNNAIMNIHTYCLSIGVNTFINLTLILP